MNLTIILLKIIGSPFYPAGKGILPSDIQEARLLFEFAKKNKIALTYLDTLNQKNKLQYFNLLDQYNIEYDKYINQSRTINRISELFNKNNVEYAIFKSIMPFPAVPNDVDIIHFGNDPTYQKAIDLMVNSEYQEVKGQADAQQTMFHDIKYGGLQHPHPPKKDVYDIDLYQKISASQLVYLEKSKLKNNVVQKPFQNIEVNGLRNYAELMVIIIHSIIPEMIFTLFVYYTTLHYIEKMDKIEINNFVKLVQENNITNSAKAHFALVAELHNQAYGFIPEKIQYIIDALGSNKKEVDNFLKSGLKMPYNYRLYTVFKIIIEKAKSAEFRKSIFNQIWYSLRPKNFFWVVHNIFLRSRRDTY